MADFEKVYQIKFDTKNAEAGLSKLSETFVTFDSRLVKFPKTVAKIITVLSSLTNNLKSATTQANLLVQSLSKLNLRASGTSAPTGLSKAEAEAKKLAIAENKAKVASERLAEQGLKKAAREAQRLAKEEEKVRYQSRQLANKEAKALANSLAQIARKAEIATARLKKFFTRDMVDAGRWMTTRVTLPILAAGGAAIKLASDLNESMNKVEVSFKDSSQQVKNFADTTLQSYGIARGTALDMAAKYGDMATSMGLTTDQAATMATSLVGLSGDLASFKNIKIDIADTALTAIFTGETESLKKLGIVMTQENLELFARERGYKKTLKTMTQAEKTQLRYSYVVAMTSNAHGDFSRTGGGAANQTRKFTEGIKQLGGEIGAVLIPAFTDVVKKLNEIVKSLGNLSVEQKNSVVKWGLLIAAIGPIAWTIGQVTTAILSLRAAFILLGSASGPLALATVGFIGLGIAIKSVYDNWEMLANSSLGEYLAGAKGAMRALLYHVGIVEDKYEKGPQMAAGDKSIRGQAMDIAQEQEAWQPTWMTGQIPIAERRGVGGGSFNVTNNYVVNAQGASADQVVTRLRRTEADAIRRARKGR